MNKELIVTIEDIELLKEMKNNCLKADVYEDEKRLLKANAITKVLYENEKLHHYKTLYQSLKKQKEELRSWLEEDIICCENSQNTNLGEYERKIHFDLYNDVSGKLEELEGVSNE